MDPIAFRLLRREDLPLFREWVNREHVARWWDEPRTMEAIEAEYLPVIEGVTTTRAYLAFQGDEPIGFIQSYTVMGSGNGWWEDETDPGARGIDQFLADGQRLGQGLGTAMITAFLARLFEEPGVTQVQTDPQPDNARAIRCYEKCGFRAVGVVDTPDGPALLMRCRR
ncbi:MAG: Aminoglycoside N(6')-acetyltransferase _ AAC(6')-Ib/AAC(6')-II [uncultured Ramlibacter sp.]|uniref:Aminoglycoside N(6')-acetyltransferase > AAC(6')-Ib/AAC(6')-II n=1 Tax=uncultured Ramlibacter sp. TaxID=260755 RepID=A0A6J4PQQ0_9BURK|nr:MAG: Aminoglycoside N(6')-acetyltransferase > AAC(6')-Ib/AAC(6')-II [uncultured Ramlibacter sp.]